MPAPFISREDLSDYLGQDVASDDKALIAVDSACDTVRTLAEQTFNAVEDDEITLDGTGTDALLLPELPVTEVSGVTEDGDALVVDDDYVLNGQGVLLRVKPAKWTKGRQNVTVTYSHGYADDDFPRDVRIVALTFAARLFGQGSGIVFESLGQRSVRYNTESTELNGNERRILAKYRRAK